MKVIAIMVMLFSTASFADVITDNSYGKVAIGMTLDEALETLKEYEALESEGNKNCYFLRPLGKKANEPHVKYLVMNNSVVIISFSSNQLGIETEKGIAIGSGRKDVLSAYGDVVENEYLPNYVLLLRKMENGNAFMFHTINDYVTSISLGKYPLVTYSELCM